MCEVAIVVSLTWLPTMFLVLLLEVFPLLSVLKLVVLKSIVMQSSLSICSQPSRPSKSSRSLSSLKSKFWLFSDEGM